MRIFNDVKQHVLFFLDVGQKKKKKNSFRQKPPGKSIPRDRQHGNSSLRS